MINKLLDGICKELYAEFGYEIYTDEVKQGFKEPCFFVSSLNPTKKQVMGNRYFRENLFCIQYFCSGNEACNEALERLYDCLEYITVDGDLVRGTKMHGEMTDEVLSFFVNYNFFESRIEDEKGTMEGVKTDTKVEEG